MSILAAVPDEPRSEPTLEEEAARYAALAEQHSRLGDELERIKARFRTELPDGKSTLAGLAITISQPTTFSMPKAAAVLSAEELAAITETTTWVSPALAERILTPEQFASISEKKVEVSPALAKAKLAPAVYAACCEASGTKRVTVR